jgi:large subunit ribosomal protein L35
MFEKNICRTSNYCYNLRLRVQTANFDNRRSFAVPRKVKVPKTKLKTHKATSKRFRLTGSGVLMRTKGGKSHFRRRTSKRVKALLSEMIPVEGKSIIRRVRRLAPNME